MRLTLRFYDMALRAARAISPIAAFGESKIARGLRGRLLTRGALVDWAESQRDPKRPLVWLHAPSVGEGLQGRAVLEALQRERPEVQAIYTFFSPSAVPLAKAMPVQAAGYLPWDVQSELGPLFDALRPSVVAFTKTEVWPGVMHAARVRQVPTVLLAATLPADAGRMGVLGRAFLRRTFSGLDRVLAIAAEDAERFRALGVPADRVEVAGDPGVDSAWERAQRTQAKASALAPFLADPVPTVVAGSTWVPDEAVLIPAFAQLRKRHPTARLIIAPHEPDEAHLSALEARVRDAGLSPARLAEVEARASAKGEDVVLVDRVGVLAALYTVGTVGYVGGGFHRHGLHSVLEPASAGIPILHGPRYSNSRAAQDLVANSGTRVVTDSESALGALDLWLSEAAEREAAAQRASAYIEAHRGAAERNARALLAHLSNPSDPSRSPLEHAE